MDECLFGLGPVVAVHGREVLNGLDAVLGGGPIVFDLVRGTDEAGRRGRLGPDGRGCTGRGYGGQKDANGLHDSTPVTRWAERAEREGSDLSGVPVFTYDNGRTGLTVCGVS